MNNIISTFTVNNDKDLRQGLMRFYYQVVYEEAFSKPIQIKLPIDKWISSNGLNMLLTFIAALRGTKDDFKIYLDLFDDETVMQIVNKQFDFNKNKELTENIIKKIIFYESMELLPLLRKSNVIIQPGKTTYENLKEILEAHKTKRYFEYSSRMLALNQLIENEGVNPILS
ncbi:MAG: hypothetical protein AABY87_11215 [bacterium]